jgi:hypothetical protein
MVRNSFRKAAFVFCLAVGAASAGLVPRGVATAAAADDPVAATVNGAAVGAGAIEAEYLWIFNQKQMVHPVNDAQKADCLRQAVDRVIVWELVRQKLAAAGQAVTGAEVDAVVTADRARIGDTFLRYIGMLGQDETSYRRRTEGVQNFKKYQKQHIAPQVKVGDEEIRAHYAKVDTYRSAEAYRVRYLQVHSFDSAGRLVHGDLSSVAARARQRVVEGASLEDVAEGLTTSQVSGRVANGYYEVGKTPLYEPALKPLIKSGDVSEVLRVTDNSYLIFRLEEKVPAKNISLEQARPEIERLLLELKLNEAIPGHAAGLKKQAEVRYVDPKYAPGN